MSENVAPKTLREWLADLALALEEQIRHGEESDNPEGARYIRISDTCAREIAREARAWAERSGAYREVT
jgi:hypothetical protein